MSDIIKTIKKLPKLLTLKGATATEISDAETQLCISFADEYKKYLAEFGAIMADGLELIGIANSAHRNVVLVTKRERELNPQVPQEMYVVENIGIDGIVIWQDSNGMIYQSLTGKKPIKIFDNLNEYLTKK
jgi:hypothetical protein